MSCNSGLERKHLFLCLRVAPRSGLPDDDMHPAKIEHVGRAVWPDGRDGLEKMRGEPAYDRDGNRYHNFKDFTIQQRDS